MTFIQSIICAVTDPSQADDPSNDYTAGYQDAYREVRFRLLRALKQCDQHLYALAPTTNGYTLTRISLEALPSPLPLPLLPPDTGPNPDPEHSPF